MKANSKRVVIATIGLVIALVLAAGGVVISRERSRVTELEEQLDSLRDEIEDSRASEERAEKATADLESDLDRVERRLERALKGALDQESCIEQLAKENVIGEQDAIFGFVSQVADGGFVFDPAEWFTGEEANRIAADEGVIKPGESVPNDYFIRNDERTEVPMRFDERAVVVLTTASRHNIPAPKCVTPGRFGTVFEDPELWQEGIRRSPYWLAESDGLVVRLVEQYLP